MNVKEDQCIGNTLFIKEYLKPGDSATISISVKLPEDLLGYKTLTLNFRLQLANTNYSKGKTVI